MGFLSSICILKMTDFENGDEKSLRMWALLSEDYNKIVIQELVVLIMDFFDALYVTDIRRGQEL